MKTRKELAKFASGVAAWEAIVHLSLLLSGSTPTIFGITLSNNLNLVQSIVPAVISFLLAWYGWSPRRIKVS